MSKLREALTGISGILVTPFDRNDEYVDARIHCPVNDWT